MTVLSRLTDFARSEGDPKVLQSGQSSLSGVDHLARGLGWFSLGLGLAEALAPRQFTRALGMEGSEALVRAFGVREIGSGILSLSVDKDVGLWSRVAGDAADIATLFTALRDDNPRRHNVVIALCAVAGIAVLDIVAAQRVTAVHSRGAGGDRSAYRHRSGFPQGVDRARGAARDFVAPADMRAAVEPPRLVAAGDVLPAT